MADKIDSRYIKSPSNLFAQLVSGFEIDHVDVNTFTVNPGICYDSTGQHVIELTSAITKLFNSTWVAGGGVGARDASPAFGNNQWFSVFVIGKSGDPSAADILTGDGLTPDTPPSGWDIWRRVRYRHTNGSAELREGRDVGEMFEYKDGVLTNVSHGVGTSPLTLTVQAPPSIRADLAISIEHSSDSTYMDITSGYRNSTSDPRLFYGYGGGLSTIGSGRMAVLRLDASSQLTTGNRQTGTGSGSITLRALVLGWEDNRRDGI